MPAKETAVRPAINSPENTVFMFQSPFVPGSATYQTAPAAQPRFRNRDANFKKTQDLWAWRNSACAGDSSNPETAAAFSQHTLRPRHKLTHFLGTLGRRIFAGSRRVLSQC
jgi:hypothetical protein